MGERDVLRLTIKDEVDERALCVLEFDGADIASNDSIYFKATEAGGAWRMSFSGARPASIEVQGSRSEGS